LFRSLAAYKGLSAYSLSLAERVEAVENSIKTGLDIDEVHYDIP